jgi:hypothetical protein
MGGVRESMIPSMSSLARKLNLRTDKQMVDQRSAGRSLSISNRERIPAIILPRVATLGARRCGTRERREVRDREGRACIAHTHPQGCSLVLPSSHVLSCKQLLGHTGTR